MVTPRGLVSAITSATPRAAAARPKNRILLAEVLIGAREPREPVDDRNFASVGGGREVDGERHLALACRRDVRPAAQRAAEELHGGLERRHAAMK